VRVRARVAHKVHKVVVLGYSDEANFCYVLLRSAITCWIGISHAYTHVLASIHPPYQAFIQPE